MLTHAYTRGLLFHYCKAHTGIDRILRGGNVRLGPLAGTNDPRETDPWFFSMVVDDGAESPPTPDDGQWFFDIQGSLDHALKRGCRLACFTQDEPDPTPDLGDLDDRVHTLRQGYDHDRMWAQYADNHTGVCLFFDRARLIECMDVHARRVGAMMVHGPVQYHHRYDALHAYERPFNALSRRELRTSGVEAFAARHRARFARSLYLHKDSDWRQEHEYRFVWIGDDDVPDEPIYVPITDCIHAVCLGARFPDDRLDEVRMLHEEQGVDVYGIRYTYGHLNIMPRFFPSDSSP